MIPSENETLNPRKCQSPKHVFSRDKSPNHETSSWWNELFAKAKAQARASSATQSEFPRSEQTLNRDRPTVNGFKNLYDSTPSASSRVRGWSWQGGRLKAILTRNQILENCVIFCYNSTLLSKNKMQDCGPSRATGPFMPSPETISQNYQKIAMTTHGVKKIMIESGPARTWRLTGANTTVANTKPSSRTQGSMSGLLSSNK